MEFTESTNIDFEGIANLINDAKYIQICGHTNPDGDCISSQLACKCALEALGKEVDVLLALNERAPHSFDFLPYFDEFKYASRVKKKADLFIMVDVPNDKRLGFAGTELKEKAKVSLTIDHHFEEKRWSDFTLTDTSAASTTTLIWELLGFMGLNGSEQTANCCLTGLKTDTGNFQFQNADLRSFRIAAEMIEAGADNSFISEKVFMRRSFSSIKIEQVAISNLEVICNGKAAITTLSSLELERCGATKNDTEGIVDILRSIDGTEVVAFLRQDQDCTKVSFRALGDFDCRELVAVYGGGGHAGAAGAKIEDTLEAAREIVATQLKGVFGK